MKKKNYWIAGGIILINIVIKVYDWINPQNLGILGLFGLIGLIGAFPKIWDERFKEENILKAAFVGFLFCMSGIVSILLTHDLFISINLFLSFIILYLISGIIFFASFWFFEKRGT